MSKKKQEYTFWNFRETELYKSLKRELTPPSILSTHQFPANHTKDHISDLLRGGIFYESHTLLQFYNDLPKEGMILDIGANIGNHQMMFNQLFPGRRIFGFEASPLNYYHLHKNTKNYPNTTNICVGLGDERSLNYITHFYENMGGSGIDVIGKEGMAEQVDVEGFEMNVFKGAHDTLKKHKPVIWVEDFEYVKDYNNSAVKYLIDEFGYSMINSSECNYLLK